MVNCKCIRAVCAGSCGPGNLHLINGLFDCTTSEEMSAMTNTDIKQIAEENCMTEDRHKEVSNGHPENAISAYGMARSTVQGAPLSSEELREIDEYWRASLYLCLGMLYLQENPLLREPLKIEHIKPRMLGHWGSDAGQCFTYIHFNRLINKYDLNAI